MIKKVALSLLVLFVSFNASADYDPSIFGVSLGASAIGSDPGVKLELSSPYFIRSRTALNLEYAGYSSSLDGGGLYGSFFVGTKSKIYSTDLLAVNFKSNIIIVPTSDLSSKSPWGLNYAITSYFKLPDSSLQLQGEFGYNLLFGGRADKFNNQLFGSGTTVSIGVACPF
jgi:hypothetical protein